VKSTLLRALAMLSIASLAACGGGSASLVPSSGASQASAGGSPFDAPAGTLRRVCANVPRGRYHCDMAIVAGARIPAGAIEHPQTAAAYLHRPGFYGPADLQQAYDVVAQAARRGAGVKIAVVDAYGYTQAASDLARYRKLFGLPACASCLRIINEHGQSSPLPPPNTNPNYDWRGEEALDVDMVTAVCPKCTVVLVQAQSDNDDDLESAVRAAANAGAVAISNSYSNDEEGASNSDYAIAGRTIVASAGDDGWGAQQPCSYASVICVGGTHLVPDARVKRGWDEVVWDGLNPKSNDCYGGPCATGSGCSAVVPKPSWQQLSSTAGCTMRNEVDVSADADPVTGVVVVCTPCADGGSPVMGYNGGTSESSPIVAGLIGLAENGGRFSPAQLWAKRGAANFNDVVSGRNDYGPVDGSCPQAYTYICVARVGYDGPTGWGTPHGLGGL